MDRTRSDPFQKENVNPLLQKGEASYGKSEEIVEGRKAENYRRKKRKGPVDLRGPNGLCSR